MLADRSSRRSFVRSIVGAAAAGTTVPYWLTSAQAGETKSKNDRPLVAAIGVGGRGSGVVQEAAPFGDVVAVCDTDLKHAEQAAAIFGGKPKIYRDYRKLLERKDVEIILNATPDHWHTAVNVAACRAGKDIYTEKPLALTIDEGKLLRKVVHETGRIVQVGTQQRSDARFRLACELVRNGRIGRLRKVSVILPFFDTKGGPYATKPVPAELDWDLWQGQAPVREYCPERVHSSFRWWWEYAGGIMTDWGQHHMDIAYWGMDMEKSGPLWVEGKAVFPNEGKPNCFSNPDRFEVQMMFPGDIELAFLGADASDGSRNGIMFTGDKGRVFVNRGDVHGKAVEELKENPLPAGAVRLYKSDNHMANFFDCVKTRKPNISTVDVAHRVITACHLSNLAVRAGRRIHWDASAEQITGDAEAARSIYVGREQRAPYGIGG
jgi:myo-inositol 2-dehydrogenase / D-chiro-inositol 1-dehydrogenase